MAWYDEAVFYHIYPLGLLGAPKQNSYQGVEHRLRNLYPWIDHIYRAGFNAIYIGPLFESVGHGYETTDYRMVDRRLGDNADLKEFVARCHQLGMHVILDGVFNHTGRDFFAFQDIRQNRENSPFRDWYCNVNFWGNTEYNDGFSYDNWGGYNLMAKLNQRNGEVHRYIAETIAYWVQEFDIDGLRLDAADVLDFGYMQMLRRTANQVKQDFWLMGEVIHGDYNRWIVEGNLHSVTNYHLHKAFYSGHNDHNFFEIAHTVRRLYEGNGQRLKLYNFVDNHDVERIYTKLKNKAHFTPVQILLYTLPGIPSVYYGSEFAIEGAKERYSDESIRPCLHLEELLGSERNRTYLDLFTRLGWAHQSLPALSYGSYRELLLTTRQYSFLRELDGQNVIVMVNNDDQPAEFRVNVPDGEYVGVLTGETVRAEGGKLAVLLTANGGEIWAPKNTQWKEAYVSFAPAEPMQMEEQESAAQEEEPVTAPETAEQPAEEKPEQESTENAASAQETAEAQKEQPAKQDNWKVELPEPEGLTPECREAYEAGRIAGLQEALLVVMGKKGYQSEQIRNDVLNNHRQESLLSWISFLSERKAGEL